MFFGQFFFFKKSLKFYFVLILQKIGSNRVKKLKISSLISNGYENWVAQLLSIFSFAISIVSERILATEKQQKISKQLSIFGIFSPTTILQPARDLGLPLIPIPAMADFPVTSDDSSDGWSDEGEEDEYEQDFSDESFTE